MITWLASYPRSGNTFSRVILEKSFEIRPVSRYVEADLFHAAQFSDLTKGPESAIKKLRLSTNHWILKTHHLPDHEEDHAIYLVRDGRDSVVSYAWYVLMKIHKLKKNEISRDLYLSTLRNLILEPDSPFGSWGENVIAWTQRPNTVIVRFEHLIQFPLKQISDALDSIGIEYTKRDQDALPSFVKLQVQKPQHFRQGKIGTWRDDMSDECHKLFWEINGEAMSLMNYA